MSIRSLTFQVVAMMAIPAFAAYHESTDYRFTFSSFAREGVITLPTEGEAKGEYTLGQELGEESTTTIQTPLFDRSIDVGRLVDEGHLTGDETERPIAYIPQDITLTSISIVTPGNVAPETLLLTLGTMTHRLKLSDKTESITLHGTWQGAVGTYTGVVHTYKVAEGETVTLNPGTEHPVFSVAFQSDDTGGQVQNRSVVCLSDSEGNTRPFLRIVGSAEMQHHIFKIDDPAHTPEHTESHSLAELLKGDASAHPFVDDPNTVIVVEFEGNGGSVTLDRDILDSPIIFGSSVESDLAHIHFPGTARLEGSITFRDGAAQGGVSIYGPSSDAGYEISHWAPVSLLMRCDITLCTPLPAIEGNWFLTHSTTIPAGRTFRLELDQPVGSENNLPNLSFADATSRLELASDAASPEDNPLGIPSKYQTLLCTQSGTLVLDRNVSVENANEEGSSVLSGFVLSDSRVVYGIPVNRPLETHVILRAGHTYDFGDRLGFMDMLGTPIGKATLTVEGGTVEVSTLSLTATDATLDIQGGTVTAESLDGIDDGTNTAITVAEGATLRLNGGLPAGAADTTATLDLTVAGTLQLSEDLAMTPALRRTLTLAGGTIESTVVSPSPDVVRVTCGDGGTSDGEGLLDVAGGGTLTGPLVVDAAAGQGDLVLEKNATLKTLRDFTGTVSGAGTLEAITGSLGEVILDDDWLTNADGKRLGDVLTGWTEDGTDYHGASDFAGTIGFTAGTADKPKTLDFTGLDELTSLGMAFRINNHQHIIMRLDQYADAVIRWPDNPEGITLTLIESGAYGGELTLPHFPHTEGEKTGVEFKFATFDPEGGYTVRKDGYSHTHAEDGVNDTLTWDNPVFTGEGAWIDIEFNGDTYNTGWFTLWDQNHKNELNGLLRGDRDDDIDDIMTDASLFSAVAHPADAQGGLALHYRPYVSFGSLEYPEEWSVAVRLTAPSAANRCLLALGNNTLVGANILKTVNSIVFATGKTGNEIVCYRFTGTDAAADGAIEELFRVTLPDILDTAHVFSVVCEGRELRLYMDGAWLSSSALPDGWNLGCGLQVGAQLGAEGNENDPTSGVHPDFWDKAQPITSATSGGVIDYLRFYKGVLTDVAMVEMFDRTPAVRENLRYVRYVPISTDPRGTLTAPDGGETWRQTAAWTEETWDAATSTWKPTGKAVDEPAEGAYLRLLVAPGDHALQVNVERLVETTENGETTNPGCYFYSPNRNYAALVVEPQEGNATAGALRLVPYGVDPAAIAKTDDALTQAVDEAVPGSTWFTTTVGLSDANNTGFQYGKLRFTGGAYDPITEGDPIANNFYGSAYLLGGTTVTEAVGTITWDENRIEYDFWGIPDSGTCEQTGTRKLTSTYSAGRAVSLIFDGGVCSFSKYADVVLPAVTTGTQTVTETWRRTGTYTRSGSIVSGTYTYTWTEGSEKRQSTSEPTGELTQGQEQVNTLQAVAGMALTRGESAEVKAWQLTGPVNIVGTVGDDTVRGNPNAGEDQKSLDVWTVVFGANSTWKFYDDTRVAGHGGEDNAHGALGAGQTGEGATRGGLFARGVQTPGRLYLDFTVGVGTGDTPGTAEDTAKPSTGNFSEQAWYRYGYEANQTTSTLSGMKPERAKPKDFDQAVAFQIRLSEKTGDVTLTLDKVPTARVQTFHVEEEAGATKPLTLKLTRAKGVAALPIWDTVVAAARLDVSNNNTGVATETSWEGNALNLRPAKGIRTPVHRGNATHGHGAFIVGATEVDWDFGAASSVPRLEVIPGAELTFTVGQDFRRQDIGGITLVAQGKTKSTFPVEKSDAGPSADDLTSAAWIHHRSADPFLGQDVELGEGAIFGFHAEAASSNADVQNEGVVLAGELRLTGNATLRADYNNPDVEDPELRIPHFIAAGGIRAMKSGVTLIVDAPSHQIADGNENHVNWHSHTSKMTGEDDFRLWKTGPGTVTFYASEPPSVTGKVTVEEGTLAVTAAADTPIGAKGLHVKAGATLADSGRMSGTGRFLALIPDGQTLSGGGTVAGRLGLRSGATYRVKQGEALTADGISVDSSLEADITIDLPTDYGAGTDYKAGTPYLKANREERNVRRRLLPLFGEARWDSIAWIDNGTTTTYAARPPQVPAPTDYAEGVPPGTIEGIIKEPLINQYQNAGHAYIGATSGRTRAGNKKLNPDELSDALLCFTNISAFVEDVGVSGTRKYVDGTNFYVGYEFGISQMAFAKVGEKDYVVLEVSVESALNEDSFPNVGFSEAQKAFVADFNGATVLSFEVLDAQGKAEPLDAKIPVEEVTDMDGTTPTGATGKRWFRIPYDELCKRYPAAEDGTLRLRASASSLHAKRP